MNNEKFKVVLDCPLCGEHELQVQELDDGNEIKQCISCGYTTANHLKGTIKDNEEYKNMDDALKSWAVEKEGSIWIPTILNTNVGIVYPISKDEARDYKGDNNMVWAYAPVINIPEEERKNYPIPNRENEYYTTKYDIENEVYFELFSECLKAIDILRNKAEEFEKQQKDYIESLQDDVNVDMISDNITDEYNRKYESKFGDMWEHLPTLKKYASECDHVLELGFRWLNSTWAFLYSMVDNNKPSKFVTCDLDDNVNIRKAKKMADKEGLDFEYIIGDDCEVDLPETDLMFIDTQHTYTQLRKELFQLHHLSRKYIILHDTVSFARHGLAESGCDFYETKGLMDATEEFLEEHGDEWEIHEHHQYCNGLLIMKRK